MSFYTSAGDAYGDATSASELLRQAGISPNLAVLGTPAMFWTPGESDPASAMTKIVVQGAQKCLKKLGFAVRTHGLMDPVTRGALAKVSGPGWASRAWIQIYGDIGREAEPLSGLWDDITSAFTPKPAPSISPVGPSVTRPTIEGSTEGRYGTIRYEDMIDRKTYFEGRTAAVRNAFKALQAAVGAKVDGRLGSDTAGKTIAVIDPMWRARHTLNMQPGDADLLAKVLASSRPQPFRVAAYADALVRVIIRYRPGARPRPKPVRPSEPTIVELDTPPVPAPTGIMDIKVAGIPLVPAVAVAGILWFATRKPAKRGGRRRGRR